MLARSTIAPTAPVALRLDRGPGGAVALLVRSRTRRAQDVVLDLGGDAEPRRLVVADLPHLATRRLAVRIPPDRAAVTIRTTCGDAEAVSGAEVVAIVAPAGVH